MKKALVLCAVLATCVPSVARADVDKGKQAQVLVDQAYEAYQREDWAKAIATYLESYKLVPSVEVLYNVATIYDKKLGEKQPALEYYRKHNAAKDASPELVAKATARIAELSREDKPAGSASPAQPSPARQHEGGDAGSGMRVTGVVLAGVGVVGLAVGSVFGLSAMSKASDARSAGCSGGTCPDQKSADTEKSAASAGTVSTISFVAGGVLAAAGVTLYLVAPSGKKESARSLRVAPSVAPGGGGLTLSGTLF